MRWFPVATHLLPSQALAVLLLEGARLRLQGGHNPEPDMSLTVDLSGIIFTLNHS